MIQSLIHSGFSITHGAFLSNNDVITISKNHLLNMFVDYLDAKIFK